MFGRRKYPPLVGTNTPEVRLARRELRTIERDLAALHHRTNVEQVRRLTARHQAWRDHLANHGVNHPAPLINW